MLTRTAKLVRWVVRQVTTVLLELFLSRFNPSVDQPPILFLLSINISDCMFYDRFELTLTGYLQSNYDHKSYRIHYQVKGKKALPIKYNTVISISVMLLFYVCSVCIDCCVCVYVCVFVCVCACLCVWACVCICDQICKYFPVTHKYISYEGMNLLTCNMLQVYM